MPGVNPDLAATEDQVRGKRRIFIVWVHDAIGRAVVAVLGQELKRRGFEVDWDRVLKTSNVPSMSLWMANKIENSAVICVVTPELVKAFNLVTDGPPQTHLGGQWEIRHVAQVLYEHGLRDGCPVIPVIPPGSSAEDGPLVLRGLQNTQFNHITGEGIDTIVKRVNDIYDHSERAARGRRLVERKAQIPSQVKDSLADELRSVDVSRVRAHELSKKWVDRAGDNGVSHSSDLLQIFKRIVLVAHYAGDLDLLRQITAICLPVVEELDLDDEIRTEMATYLLMGRTFLLSCEHKMEEARKVAEDALTLATDAKDATLIAKAERCLARLHAHLAELASQEARAAHLRQARTYAMSAMNHFRAVDSDDKHLAMLALAEVRLAEFRHERNTRSLHEASWLSAGAAKGFTDKRLHTYYEAKLMQAEVAFASEDNGTASDLIDETLRDLRSRVERAMAFTELLGKAHLLRARIWVSLGRADAQAEIREAHEVFEKLGLQRMVAECDWLLFKHERKRYRFAVYDIKALERQSPDPVLRMKVALQGRTWSAIEGLLGRIGDKNWKRAIESSAVR